MAMIPSNFKFQKALKKGSIGEGIIRRLLEQKGWVVYQPSTEGAHSFDMMAILKKKTAVAIDVKTKARMNYLPATGVDMKHFLEYRAFSIRHQMPFYIVFVDEMERKIYGNQLGVLEEKRIVNNVYYPYMMHTKQGKDIRVWPLEAMRPIAPLPDDEALYLESLNQRSYNYEPDDGTQPGAIYAP